MTNNSAMPAPPIYTDLDQSRAAQETSPTGGLIKVPEAFFGAEHPNTKMMLNMIYQGDLVRIRALLESGIGSHGVFQIIDRGYRGNDKPMFHKQAILYLSLIGLVVYCNRGNLITTIAHEGGPSMLRCQFATGVQSSDDVLTFPVEYIAILMESFNTLIPLLKSKLWSPFDTTCLLYRRRYHQSRTPIIGYPDLLRCALLRSANYNLTGFIVGIRRELVLSRLIYQGSLMVQHFDISLAQGTGTRRVFEAPQGPRYVMPNLTSVSRRLLALAVYQDPNGRLLSQVLSAMRECSQAGAYCTMTSSKEARGSLLLWLQQLVMREHKETSLFRCMGQQTEKLLTESGELQDNYLRYDALNCISLLLSLLSRHDPSSAPDDLAFGRRILDAASAVALQAGLADSLIRYAWPDQLLALQSLINPSGPEVNFKQFTRLLQHLPSYASTLAAANPDMRGADRWRVPVRKSILEMDWKNSVENQMLDLLSGETSVRVVASSDDATDVLVFNEQAADRYCELPAWRDRRQFDYGAFYRLFERRYSMWASCVGLEPDLRPKEMLFREDEPFSSGYERAVSGA